MGGYFAGQVKDDNIVMMFGMHGHAEVPFKILLYTYVQFYRNSIYVRCGTSNNYKSRMIILVGIYYVTLDHIRRYFEGKSSWCFGHVGNNSITKIVSRSSSQN
jgi:hypothetical protein